MYEIKNSSSNLPAGGECFNIIDFSKYGEPSYEEAFKREYTLSSKKKRTTKSQPQEGAGKT